MQHDHARNSDTRTSHLDQAQSRSTSNNGSPASSHRRRHTPTPSFMNYQNGAAARALTQSPTTPQTLVIDPALQSTAGSARSRPSRTLLLAFASTPPPTTLKIVERLLRIQPITSVAILADSTQEHSAKDLKIQLYSLVGQLQQEIGVHIYLRAQWTEDECQAAVNHMDQLSAVLCSPSYDSADHVSDILAVSERDISEMWRSTFGFLHTIAKACFPRLAQIDEHGKSMFATTSAPKSSSAAVKVNQAACESLLAQLSSQYASKGVSVGQIEQLLPPERKPVVLKKENGVPKLEMPSRSQHVGEWEHDGGESPTRLYEMWALHEQLDTV